MRTQGTASMARFLKRIEFKPELYDMPEFPWESKRYNISIATAKPLLVLRFERDNSLNWRIVPL
jgi:hypothetical protein